LFGIAVTVESFQQRGSQHVSEATGGKIFEWIVTGVEFGIHGCVGVGKAVGDAVVVDNYHVLTQLVRIGHFVERGNAAIGGDDERRAVLLVQIA
jgi:hypothetical protein